MKYTMKAKVLINPTEDLDKVLKALSNILDYDELEIDEDYITVTGDEDSLLRLRESLEKRRIRNTARKIMLKGLQDKIILFKLSKQAAYAGLVNIISEDLSALGEINVTVETGNVDAFLDWIAPQIK
ncbi:MAG: RNA-binding domain-containing protein [Methanobacterium sp.]